MYNKICIKKLILLLMQVVQQSFAVQDDRCCANKKQTNKNKIFKIIFKFQFHFPLQRGK